ncbi:hypothetical protein, partial [Escherichia coli]|uniref:hypothetical protein n=1 Tax=Escherichia coli TaxID=562 RepID=UPI001BB26532
LHRGSQRYGCNKAGYKAATYPSCQNNGCLANGMRSYKYCGPIVTGYACSPNAWNGAASSGR